MAHHTRMREQGQCLVHIIYLSICKCTNLPMIKNTPDDAAQDPS